MGSQLKIVHYNHVSMVAKHLLGMHYNIPRIEDKGMYGIGVFNFRGKFNHFVPSVKSRESYLFL